MNLKLPSGQFYGSTLKDHDNGGFSLTETTYSPRLNLPSHSHERPYFGLVLRGTYTEAFGNKRRVCKQSMLVFHPSEEVHSQTFYHAEVRLFRIELSPRWLEHLNERVLIRNSSTDFHDHVACRLAARLYYEFREMDDASPLVIEGLALEILGEVSRSAARTYQRPPQRWLKQARELIEARSTERLTLSEIAEAVGVHPVYLSREFRRHYRSSVGEYIRRLRIELAYNKMAEPDTSLAEIAISCGFHDQSHFSKAFKRVTNTTPAAHRASLLSH